MRTMRVAPVPSRLKTAALVGVVGLQLCVPALAMLTQEPPARFAFSMYTGRGVAEVEILDVDGRPLPFEPDELVAGFRPGINWYAHLPEYLCQEVAGAQIVTVSQKGHVSRLTCG